MAGQDKGKKPASATEGYPTLQFGSQQLPVLPKDYPQQFKPLHGCPILKEQTGVVNYSSSSKYTDSKIKCFKRS